MTRFDYHSTGEQITAEKQNYETLLKERVRRQSIQSGLESPAVPGQRRRSFPGLVQSSSEVATHQWTYGGKPAVLASNSYSGWQAQSGAATFTMRNISEVGNTATMVNGLDMTTLDIDGDSVIDATVKPIPDSALVWVHVVIDTSGNTTYWFDRANPIEPACP